MMSEKGPAAQAIWGAVPMVGEPACLRCPFSFDNRTPTAEEWCDVAALEITLQVLRRNKAISSPREVLDSGITPLQARAANCLAERAAKRCITVEGVMSASA